VRFDRGGGKILGEIFLAFWWPAAASGAQAAAEK
jgi:hypothetical protein